MLKTNSREARANFKRYILDNFYPEGYTDKTDFDGFGEVARFILDTFRSEYRWSDPKQRIRFGYNQCEAFVAWCSGLPSVLDTCYYYNRSAVEDVAEILEETEAEASRFDEETAERFLSEQIFRHLIKAEEKPSLYI